MPYLTILSIFYDSLLAISHDWYALSLWALTLIPPPCGLRPRGRNQVRAFRSPFLIWRWYWYMPCVLDLGSCKCINRDVWHQHRDHSFVKSFWQLRYRFWSGDHSLISSSSLHFVGIDTVVVSSMNCTSSKRTFLIGGVSFFTYYARYLSQFLDTSPSFWEPWLGYRWDSIWDTISITSTLFFFGFIPCTGRCACRG